MDTIEPGLWFCSNPDCDLHVCPGDPGVQGAGNWAELPNGHLIGRGLYEGRYYCDWCGTTLIRACAETEIPSPRRDTQDLVEQQSLPLEFAA